jgi:hypothetical protein
MSKPPLSFTWQQQQQGKVQRATGGGSKQRMFAYHFMGHGAARAMGQYLVKQQVADSEDARAGHVV